MYLVGKEHPNRERTAAMLREAVARQERLVTSAEGHQEILHRYRGLDRLDLAGEAIRLLDELVDEVFAVDVSDVRAARGVLTEAPGVSSRDALHIAVMRRSQVDIVMSFDSGFDAVSRIQRRS